MLIAPRVDEALELALVLGQLFCFAAATLGLLFMPFLPNMILEKLAASSNDTRLVERQESLKSKDTASGLLEYVTQTLSRTR
jgi:hypothetical protein